MNVLNLQFDLYSLNDWMIDNLGSETLNPIPAGVLENQDTLGGGQFDPPL